MEAKRPRLNALTGLRYWAALTVVVAHVASDNDQLDIDLLRGLSTIGMPLFFTLSGFLLCYNYQADFASNREGTLLRFYRSRFARIYPAYLLALLLSFSFMGNFFHDLRDRPDDTLRCLAFDLTLTQSWIHLPVFSDYWRPRTVTQAYLGIGWSVSTEMFFYVTFPLLIPVLRRLRQPRRTLALAATIWITYAAVDLWYFRGVDDFWGAVAKYSKARWLFNYSPYGRWGEFLIGCLLGRLYEIANSRPAGRVETWGAEFVSWLCIPTLVWGSSLVGGDWIADRLHLNIGLAPVCGLLIYCLARYPTALQKVLAGRTFVRLGESSYCLFLLHPLVQSFYLPRTRGEDELCDWHVVTYNHFMMFVVLHLLALGCHEFVEAPMRRRLRGESIALKSPASGHDGTMRRLRDVNEVKSVRGAKH